MSLSCLSNVKRGDDNKRPDVQSSHTDIAIVFDRSQSMQWMMGRSCDGLLRYIGDMKEQNLKNCTTMRITLVPFDTSRGDAIYDAEDINSVRNLEPTEPPFIAQGLTCLYDTAISVLEEQNARCADDDHNWKKIYVVITDGADNQSAHTRQEYREAVKNAKDSGTTAIFMGANQDAVQTGQQYGFDASHAVTFSGGAANVAMGACLSGVTQAAYNGNDVGFTQLQREESLGSDYTNTVPMLQVPPPFNPPLLPAARAGLQSPVGNYSQLSHSLTGDHLQTTLPSNFVLPQPQFVRTDTVATQESTEGSTE